MLAIIQSSQIDLFVFVSLWRGKFKAKQALLLLSNSESIWFIRLEENCVAVNLRHFGGNLWKFICFFTCRSPFFKYVCRTASWRRWAEMQNLIKKQFHAWAGAGKTNVRAFSEVRRHIMESERSPCCNHDNRANLVISEVSLNFLDDKPKA